VRVSELAEGGFCVAQYEVWMSLGLSSLLCHNLPHAQTLLISAYSTYVTHTSSI
jgi:hypothetical protein